jgi:hypothetical protein
MSATIYKLPTADDFAWVEDLLATVESRLDEIHSDLKAPFDGNPETQAEPATLEYVGRVFLFARFLRHYAEGFMDRAEGIEKDVVELRQIQEEDDGLLPDKESYTAYARRYARQWAEGAESAAETLVSAEAREGGESDAS